jgi:hypothetical protein
MPDLNGANDALLSTGSQVSTEHEIAPMKT